MVQEQIAIAKLKSREHIDALEVLRRKIDDKRVLLRERRDRAAATLRYHFGNLLELVSRKSEEVVKYCSSTFEKLLEELSRDAVRV